MESSRGSVQAPSAMPATQCLDSGRNRSPVKRSGNFVEIVFERLLEDILAGRYEPGEKINESLLANRFEVSRGPIREALRRIEARGLVTYEPNVGARVAMFSATDFLHLLDVREALEGMACRLAAQNMTQDQIDGIRAALERRELEDERHAPLTPTGDRDLSYRDIQLEFHYLIAKSCGNPMLSKTLCEDFYHTMRVWRRYQVHVPRRGRKDIDEHRKIIDAIEDREPDFAETLMRRHIRLIRENWLHAR